MAYEKQNFIQGQVVTADDLNHMEEGIAEAHNHPVTSVGGKTGDVNADPCFADAVTATTDYGYARLYSNQYSLGLELKGPAMSQPTCFLTAPSDGNPGVSVNGNYGVIYTSINPPPALAAYPVGSIYMSTDGTSPAAKFGGSWEQIVDRFLVGAGSGYPVWSFGGEYAVTLTVDQMPSHNHGAMVYNTASSTAGWAMNNTSYNQAGYAYDKISYTGGGAAHNNIPPYVAVYMWRRTA